MSLCRVINLESSAAIYADPSHIAIVHDCEQHGPKHVHIYFRAGNVVLTTEHDETPFNVIRQNVGASECLICPSGGEFDDVTGKGLERCLVNINAIDFVLLPRKSEFFEHKGTTYRPIEVYLPGATSIRLFVPNKTFKIWCQKFQFSDQ